MKQKLRDLKLIRDNINTKIRNRDTMLRDIMLSEPDGLSTAELKSKLGFHRDTIHGIGIELINEGLITKHGKFGRYHLTRASLEDPEIIASFFGAKIMRNFYSLGQEPICIKNIFCNQNLCKTALTVDEKKLKRRLLDKSNFFEFALRLGAILTYQIMQSMRYCQLHDLSSDHVYKTSSKSRDEKMLKYIQNMINPSSLIFAFRDLHSLHSRLKPHRLIEVIADERDAKIYERQLKTHPSILELRQGKFEELEGLYQETFPELFADLEKIRKDIPMEIEMKQRSIQENVKKIRNDPKIKGLLQLKKEDPNHTKCGGKLLPEIRNNLKGKHTRKCSKCSRWIQIKRVKKRNERFRSNPHP